MSPVNENIFANYSDPRILKLYGGIERDNHEIQINQSGAGQHTHISFFAENYERQEQFYMDMNRQDVMELITILAVAAADMKDIPDDRPKTKLFKTQKPIDRDRPF